MQYIHRELEKQMAQATRHFPAVVLTGPRRAGKTMLLRRLFPRASCFLLQDPGVVAGLRADPRAVGRPGSTAEASLRSGGVRGATRPTAFSQTRGGNR